MMKNQVYTWWWSCQKLEGKSFENFGDILAKYIVEKLSGKKAIWTDPRSQHWYDRRRINLVTGSIIKYATRKCNVWGVGILSANDPIRSKNIFAVRGPQTVKRLHSLGIKVKPPMGDPALVLPHIYKPHVDTKYQLGIIPHYTDIEQLQERYKANNDVLVIDMRQDIEPVINQITSCARTLSSSLHGLIVSHAYKRPSLRFETHNRISGDGIKYADYFGSVNIDFYEPFSLDEIEQQVHDDSFWERHRSLAHLNVDLEKLIDDLIAACPFL